jgi:hypothetical protein
MCEVPFSDLIDADACRYLPFLSAVGRCRNVAESACSTDSGELWRRGGNGRPQSLTQNEADQRV